MKHFMPKVKEKATDGEILSTQEQNSSCKSSTFSNEISFISVTQYENNNNDDFGAAAQAHNNGSRTASVDVFDFDHGNQMKTLNMANARSESGVFEDS